MHEQHGFRVLVVADDAPFAGPLRADGHEVIVAGDGPSALATSARMVLDVVIMDLGLPGVDGHALAQEIRRQVLWRKPMFIALGHGSGEAACQRCREAGIDLYLVKPVGENLLRGFLARLQAVVRDIESFDPVI
jgi:two-component system CheB/CheR fusion protein